MKDKIKCILCGREVKEIDSSMGYCSDCAYQIAESEIIKDDIYD